MHPYLVTQRKQQKFQFVDHVGVVDIEVVFQGGEALEVLHNKAKILSERQHMFANNAVREQFMCAIACIVHTHGMQTRRDVVVVCECHLRGS